MTYLIKGARVVDPANKTDSEADILVSGGKIEAVGKNLKAGKAEI